MSAREIKRAVAFGVCLLIGFLLIFSFLCFSSHAAVSQDIKSFDYDISKESVFGGFSSGEKNIAFDSNKSSRKSFDFQQAKIKTGKNRRSTKLAANYSEGMDLFITVSSIGLKWKNVW